VAETSVPERRKHASLGAVIKLWARPRFVVPSIYGYKRIRNRFPLKRRKLSTKYPRMCGCFFTVHSVRLPCHDRRSRYRGFSNVGMEQQHTTLYSFDVLTERFQIIASQHRVVPAFVPTTCDVSASVILQVFVLCATLSLNSTGPTWTPTPHGLPRRLPILARKSAPSAAARAAGRLCPCRSRGI